MSRRDQKIRVLAKGFALVAVLLAAAAVLEATGIADRFGQEFVDREIRGQGLRGEALFVLVTAAAMAVGLPRQVPAFFAGYAFGFVAGVPLALLSTLLGTVTSFGYARFISHGLLGRREGRSFGRITTFLRRETFHAAMVLRLLPVGHNLGTNIAAGVSGVRLLPFLAGSAIGYLPQTIIFALMGSGVTVAPTLRIVIGVTLFVVSSLIGLRLALRYRGLDPEDEDDEAAPAEPAP